MNINKKILMNLLKSVENFGGIEEEVGTQVWFSFIDECLSDSELASCIEWECVPMSEEVCLKLADRWDWKELSKYQNFSLAFKEKYFSKLDWSIENLYRNLTEDFIERHEKNLFFEMISPHLVFSEDFLHKYADRLDWTALSWRQRLSEAMIERYADQVDWELIAQHQPLSLEFCQKHASRLPWFALENNFYVSHQDLEFMKDKFPENEEMSPWETFRRTYQRKVKWSRVNHENLLKD